MIDFTNENINLDQIPKYEEITLTPPNKNYWIIIVINLIIFLVFLGIGLSALMLLDKEIKAQYRYISGGYSIFAILLFVFYRASFKKRGFALREKDIVYKHGIIAETTTIIPLNRIQHVALDEGLFSRIYKLGKLQVFTAGGQSGHLSIGGIDIEKAKAIKEMLLTRINQLYTQPEHTDGN